MKPVNAAGKPGVTAAQSVAAAAWEAARTGRVEDLARRVREAMNARPERWDCPERIEQRRMAEPLPVRKARAIALKLSRMPASSSRVP